MNTKSKVGKMDARRDALLAAAYPAYNVDVDIAIDSICEAHANQVIILLADKGERIALRSADEGLLKSARKQVMAQCKMTKVLRPIEWDYISQIYVTVVEK